MKNSELFSLATIRSQSQRLFERALGGEGEFHCNLDQLPRAGEVVSQSIARRYPTGEILPHARINHLLHGDPRRLDQFHNSLDTSIDLTIISVLLDAGAGAKWSFCEGAKTYRASEGLGIASVKLFKEVLRGEGNALALKNLSEKDFFRVFQVTEENPLAGARERLSLLKNLGQKLPGERPASSFKNINERREIDCEQIFSKLIDLLSPLWENRQKLADGISLGDTWHHPALGTKDSPESYVPFHKLTQWCTYSLTEVYRRFSYPIKKEENLTGLPEYRNGGLFIDTGVLTPKNPPSRPLPPDSPTIVEWRALTVILIDKLHPLVAERLGRKLSLAELLEGGTWWAGRELANEKRGGLPPIAVDSDGTVF